MCSEARLGVKSIHHFLVVCMSESPPESGERPVAEGEHASLYWGLLGPSPGQPRSAHRKSYCEALFS